jgi:hypothetical protein
MVYTFEVSESNNKNKKLKIVIYKDGVKFKTFHVGDNRYSDYIQYYGSSSSFADERKRLYLLRHHKEDNNNFLTRAYWAKNLLWNKPRLDLSIKDIVKKSELEYNDPDVKYLSFIQDFNHLFN